MGVSGAARVPRWALPGELAALADPPARPERTLRDWAADVLLFGFAVVMWLWFWVEMDSPDPEFLAVVPEWMITVDPWVGAAACLALWWRRRFPLALAIAMVPVLTVSSSGFGAVLVSVLTVAVHRGPVSAVLLTLAHLAQAIPFTLAYQPPGITATVYAIMVLLMFATPLGWGIAVRVRRQLVGNLRREAQRQRREHAARLVETRRAERERIAREMHDVLAHRISLLSVHAGALAYRTAQARAGAGAALTTQEMTEAISVIRDNAHQALVELGEVLSVLRSDGSAEDPAEAPRLSLAGLAHLVAEARGAGQLVELVVDPPPGSGPLPRPQEQRTIYRVVQEGLTNARKHAPGSPVTVRVRLVPGDELRVVITNLLPAGAGADWIPGAGAGLTGLAERVRLDGGNLDYGPGAGGFRLAATLPWRG